MDKIPTQIMADLCLSGANIDINALYSQIGISSAKLIRKNTLKSKHMLKIHGIYQQDIKMR